MNNLPGNALCPSWAAGWRFLVGLLCSLAGQHANAAYLPLNCPGYYTKIDLGNLIALQPFTYPIMGTCTIDADLPGSLYVTKNETKVSGTFTPRISVKDAFTNLEVPDTGMGQGVQLPVALPIKAGSKFSFVYIITGTAEPADIDMSGQPFSIQVNLQAYSTTGLYARTNIHALTLSYRVVVPTCSLGSAKNLSLAFGTLTSQDFATSQRTAEISLNCSNASQVDATLVPTQAALSDSMGVSATTLDGLSMAATWVDNGSAVAFNSPRTIALSKGDNLIRLGFRPRLNTPDSPAGEFSSQYTLNLTYR